ncbi:hypothetical protein BKA08_001814 [Nocardioides marinisabuli]|uniref:Uncharacterized protein n=1 Tax=Nocardioides marinisabuli TaxID=419476 RepID=A0A7Y9JQT9_9ACTN|nr:hypothetical protein [Nocardioides marinisabuli]NYD57576.1 hypothetical protein [Nocardioides marinisabuli]
MTEISSIEVPQNFFVLIAAFGYFPSVRMVLSIGSGIESSLKMARPDEALSLTQ